MTLLSKRYSSDESSILNWSSIPSDLPGAVDDSLDRGSMENVMFLSDADEIRARCRSTPTITERRESNSTISISGMRIDQNGPLTADVAVQVNSGRPIFQFPDVSPPLGSVSQYFNGESSPHSHSTPQSPFYNGRKLPSHTATQTRDGPPYHDGRVIRTTRRGPKAAVIIGVSPQIQPKHRGQSYKRFNAENVSKN